MMLSPIAYIQSDFPTKFGIPRQSGVIEALRARIVFLPKYRQEEAFRGLEGYSHLWLIWGFSQVKREGWSATVRPPRLGGNQRMGVYATRSPFRPNPLGLSSVRLLGILKDPELGTVLDISGADLMDGTPIYDVKPYIPYTDCHSDAKGGFSEDVRLEALEVDFPNNLLEMIPQGKREALLGVLRHDPRPHYHNDPSRVYGFFFTDYEIKFTVSEGRLTVCSVALASDQKP